MTWRFKMSGNGNSNGSAFRAEELVKIQGRDFVVIGGRLRLLHSAGAKASIITEVIDYTLDQHAVVRAKVLTETGEFTGTGVASAGRDPKLVDALVELAETRAIARALRFAGIGVECVGFEELGAGPILDGTAPPQELRVAGGNAHQHSNGNGGSHQTPATSAQRRAIVAIARSAGRDVADLVGVVYPGVGLDDLTLSMASAVIDRARGKSNGNGHAAGPGR